MDLDMELRWINKHRVLYYDLDADGVPGKPRWVAPDAEVLARPARFEMRAEHGETKAGNRLIRGDNLVALQVLARELGDRPPAERVKVAYIDPPYNTAHAFEQYDDNLEHSEWLGLMYQRLKWLRECLRPDGVLFVQIDDGEHAYLQALLDEVYGADQKLATIIWRRRQSQANLAQLSTIHDYILAYARDKARLDPAERDKIHDQIWADTSRYGYNQRASKEIARIFHSKTAFDTPKPELLLYNLLQLASAPGDRVLDCFLGSGTTAAVAHKMGRRWIGIEMGTHAERLCLERLKRVLDPPAGADPVGISERVNWQGGGGFQYVELVTGADDE